MENAVQDLPPSDFVRDLDRSAKRVATPLENDGKTVWRVWGTGPALMLLHGGYGSWLHWARNVEDLARDFTVLVPDMPGFGDSDRAPEPVTVDVLARIVAEGARDILGSTATFRIAGFSFGSVIGGHAPRFADGAVEHLIVVGFNRLGIWPLKRPPMKSWRQATTPVELAAAQRHNLAAMMIHDDARIDALAVHLQTENTRRARVRSLDIVATHDMPQRLREAGAPVGAIWGEHDVTLITGINDAIEAFTQILPGARYIVIDGAGHWVQFEAADRFNQALRMLIADPQPGA